LKATAILTVIVAATLSVQSGCGTAAHRDSPYSAADGVTRDTVEAQRLTQRAADLMATDADEAEALLRKALAADLFHGPAHNNLGTLHLARGELYEAASEFEWARKLMPGHPDPRINLGLALERAGRAGEAIDAYEAALDVFPGHLPATQALARAQVRHSQTDDRTATLLDEISLRGESERWREWARLQRIRLAE